MLFLWSVLGLVLTSSILLPSAEENDDEDQNEQNDGYDTGEQDAYAGTAALLDLDAGDAQPNSYMLSDGSDYDSDETPQPEEPDFQGQMGDDGTPDFQSSTGEILGTAQNDTLEGTQVNIYGFGGDDEIVHHSSNIVVGPAPQEIEAGHGDDHVTARNGHVSVSGGDGNDTVIVGANSVVYGGDGHDTLRSMGADVETLGGLGDDTIAASIDLQPLQTSPGSENGFGFEAADTYRVDLSGGDGKDIFELELTLNSVQGEGGMPVVATVEDYDAASDFAIIKLGTNAESEGYFPVWFETLYQDTPPELRPQLNGGTEDHELSFERFEVTQDGSHTDIVLKGSGSLDGVAIEQEFCVRFLNCKPTDLEDIVIVEV